MLSRLKKVTRQDWIEMNTEQNIAPKKEPQTTEEDIPEWEDFFVLEIDDIDGIVTQQDGEESQAKPPVD